MHPIKCAKTNNDCSLLSFILAQFLLLEMGYQNIFVLSDTIIVTSVVVETACFDTKTEIKTAKLSRDQDRTFFETETKNNRDQDRDRQLFGL